jgi:hypothetical protein
VQKFMNALESNYRDKRMAADYDNTVPLQ